MQTAVSTPSVAKDASLESIDAVVREVRDAFDRGTTRPIRWRIAQLDALERMMSECEAEIFEALRIDLGKPAVEAYGGEISLPKSEISHLRKKLREWSKEERVAAPLAVQPARATILREPLGVVLVIAPWNYPFQLAVSPLIGAIAAGNAVVVKPSEVTPKTSAVMAKLFPRYLDSSAIRVVEGGVPETTRLLEQKWDHIFYTGNGVVGRVVMTAAAKHLTPVTLELGGKSPVYIHESANLEVAARRIAFGKFYNCGQTCIAPDYVLCADSVHDAFVAALKNVITEFYGDDPKASPDYARIVNERHHRRLATLVAGSGKVAHGGVMDEATRFIAPTVLVDVAADAPIMADEIFGPVLPVLKIGSVDEAIRFVNARPKPLALYVFAEKESIGDAFVERTSSGAVCVNNVVLHIMVPDLPFGGVGESGMGAYHGRLSFDTFAHAKPVLRKPTQLDPKVAYPPYSDFKAALFRKLM